jgi:predicted small lipoprotein YifL
MLKNIRLVIFTTVCGLIVGGALVACGTKGPLYIPEQRYPQEPLPQTEISPQPAAPEANIGEASSPAQ